MSDYDERGTKVFTLTTYLSIGLVTAFFAGVFLLSPLSAWDTPGHVFAAAYFEQHLWPWFSGWNSLAFGGYPQGYFYPSLFHWLAGGLGKVIGVTASLKILVVFSVALLPFSLNSFLKSLGVRGYDKLLALIWIFVILTVAPMSFGGTFQGLIVGGLLTHQFAMPLYFFYLTWLKEGKNSTRKLMAASALLALIVLAHAFVAIGAVLASLVYLFIFYRSKRLAIRYGAHVLVAATLSLLWTVPLVLFHEYQSGRYLEKYEALWFFIAAVVTIIGFAIAKTKGGSPIRTIAFLLSGLLLPLWLSSAIFPRLNFPYPLHMHRLWVFVMIYVVSILSLATKRFRQSLLLGISIIIFISVFLRVYEAGELQKGARVFLPKGFSNHQLGLIAVPRNSADDVLGQANARHLLTHSFLMQGARLLSGLFIESAANGAAINSTLVELMGKPYLWGVFAYDSNSELLAEHLKFLGVCWIGTLHPEMIDASMKRLGASQPFLVSIPMQINNQSIKRDLSVYRIPCSRGEVISSLEVVPDTEWKKRVEQWWPNNRALSSVLVSVPRGVSVDDSRPFDSRTSVQVDEIANDHFRVLIETPVEQFVYLKVPYFPNWRAYQNGNEIPLFRAAPNQMVIKGKGIVELHFQRSIAEYASYAVSILAWLAVGWFIWKPI
ncbi:hypothetical protein L0156_19125 [bacterium]|nr:hypothetical protein [bacterium]